MQSDPLLLLIQSIDKKVDQLQEDVSSLKESRAENRGIVKTSVAFSMAAAGLVSWVFDRFAH